MGTHKGGLRRPWRRWYALRPRDVRGVVGGGILLSAPKFNCRGCVVCLTIGVFVLEAKEEERVERGVGKRVEFMLLTVVDVVVEVRFV